MREDHREYAIIPRILDLRRHHLERHPDEFVPLFNTILINITSFFRDASAWRYVADQVIPAILSQRANRDPIRVWCPGCASGEEPYTVAMLLALILFEDRDLA